MRRAVWQPKNWNDGYADAGKRFRVYRPDYPRAWSNGYAFRAHVVWWINTSKAVPKRCVLHHKDGNCLNDAFDNLEVLSYSAHLKLHTGNDIELICTYCKKVFAMVAGRVKSGRGKYCSAKCYADSRRGKRRDKKVREKISAGVRASRKEAKRRFLSCAS